MECKMWEDGKFGITEKELRKSIESARANRLWVLQSLESLRREYLNKWVAVHKKKIIASDYDYDTVISAVRKKGISVAEVEIQLVTPENLLWIL
jgi:hypothetical protein